jgi:hypothetical protein
MGVVSADMLGGCVCSFSLLFSLVSFSNDFEYIRSK